MEEILLPPQNKNENEEEQTETLKTTQSYRKTLGQPDNVLICLLNK